MDLATNKKVMPIGTYQKLFEHPLYLILRPEILGFKFEQQRGWVRMAPVGLFVMHFYTSRQIEKCYEVNCPSNLVVKLFCERHFSVQSIFGPFSYKPKKILCK